MMRAAPNRKKRKENQEEEEETFCCRVKLLGSDKGLSGGGW
jgi:hypothetical protein